MLLYMKILTDHTGNPIYPLWWNFFANAVGKWEFAPINAGQASVRPVLGVLLVASAAGLVWSLWRRPQSYMLLTFGFGYWVFVTGMLGFTSYLASWVWWMPVTRVFAFPYAFGGILLAVVALWWAPRRLGRFAVPLGWGVIVSAIVASQLVWIPINVEFGPSEAEWQAIRAESIQLGGWYNTPPYAGHALAVPNDRPDITYGLARFGNVEGKHLVSEMYDPFAYLPSSYSYSDHRATVDTLVECWLADTDVKMIAIPDTDANLSLVKQRNADWFTPVGFLDESNWDVEGVNAPRPSAAECQAARSAAR
jgi:hypothetical protein